MLKTLIRQLDLIINAKSTFLAQTKCKKDDGNITPKNLAFIARFVRPFLIYICQRYTITILEVYHVRCII